MCSTIENNAKEFNTPAFFQSKTIDDKDNVLDNILDVEKELLKNEISVVNNELSLLLSKMKNAEKGLF